MRIMNEDDILRPEIRKQIIEDIEGQENRRRKEEAYRRYQCFKDMTNRYVVELFLQHLEEETVKEMLCAISNISITKKVVDKLARVYSNGVERKVGEDEAATETVEKISKVLCLNSELKKTNRFLRLQKNVALYLKPCPTEEDGEKKWTIKPTPLNPYLYDVVEDYYDRTKPLVYVLSDFKPGLTTGYSLFDPGRRPLVDNKSLQLAGGDRKDQIIADSPEDNNANKKLYIFWSDKYHFTCDEIGNIIAIKDNEKNENPIGKCPIVNFSIDQDGSFWAQGGGDIVEGSILINSVISHTLFAGIMQGYGQLFMSGENLPRKIKFGITQSIIAEYKKDDQPEPKAMFINANPQLQDLRGLIEMYIALLLTTNNLSTSGISAQLQGSSNIASGVALIIDKAESLEDVKDQEQVFTDKEPEVFEIVSKINETYGAAMVKSLKGLVLPEDFKESFSNKFNEPQAIATEKEKLENLKARKELGLDSMLDLLKKEDPNLTEKQAEDKLKQILKDAILEQTMRQEMMTEMGVVPDESTQNNSNGDGNISDTGPVRGKGPTKKTKKPNPE